MRWIYIVVTLLVSGCVHIPDGIKPVQGFELSRSPVIDDSLKLRLIETVKNNGFDPAQLLFVEQTTASR